MRWAEEAIQILKEADNSVILMLLDSYLQDRSQNVSLVRDSPVH